ncbi:GntR family transcriptional regulator [Vineibacter terrae]|uniref:GntR family transcriptional regulator n=1 Tax=Vineibacter terrae TaxID=2586908 RepID=UPI002E3269AE|nr:GntR family transcriptional regulator [Vineibacter terrae]HEX2890634.1 GntR family transcriptional regulator [Vineibacter terrae]
MTMPATLSDDKEDLAGLAEASGKSLGELAYETLLDRMLSKDLTPGTVLQERALGHEMRISRTPIREALARLESEGFVTRHAGRLLIVRDVPVQELMQIFHVRALLEVEAVALATDRIAAGKLASLRTLFADQMQGPIPDGGNHWDADDLLHGTIAEASGNVVLADLVRSLRRKTRMFSLKRMPERFIIGSQEHLAIIDALERRDAPAARQAMALHLENSKRSILQVLGKI